MNEEEESKKSNEEYEKHAKKISIADMKKDDYYKVLGLDGLKWMATEEQIRSAYRKLVLKYHPDKLTNPTPEDRQIFLRVQDAYDVLGNPEKRKAYFFALAIEIVAMILQTSSSRSRRSSSARTSSTASPVPSWTGADSARSSPCKCFMRLLTQSAARHHRYAVGGGGGILPILARFQVVACVQRVRRVQPRCTLSEP